jgi:hypothetical protein
MSERDVEITAGTMWQVGLNDKRKISITLFIFAANANVSGASITVI